MSEKKSPLLSVDDSTIYKWREVIAEASQSQRIYVLSDTETTSNQKKTPDGLFNRVVEWSMAVCVEGDDGMLSLLLDKKGKPIAIDEPINFLAVEPGYSKLAKSTSRIPPDAVNVHGITPEYLMGEAEGKEGRGMLPQEAPNFKAVMSAVKSLFSEMSYTRPDEAPVMMFYNAPFDVGFLELEAELWEMPNIQSYFAIVDLAVLVKRHCGFLKKKTLDAAYEWGAQQCPEIENIERPYHSALTDSTMMLPVYNAVIKQLRQGAGDE